MNTKLDIFADKQMQLEVNKMIITNEIIKNQSEQCEELFEEWQGCIKRFSWNNVDCITKYKPDYELCIRKRNYMQTIFDNK